MNDDELKRLWQEQPLRNPPSTEQLVSAMQSRATQFREIIGARDLRELWACAFVIVIFGIFYFTVYREPISRLGDLIVIGGTIFIAWRLVYTKRSNPPAPVGATVVEALRAELKSVRAQSALLRSVHWWYLLPLTVGEIVATWGLPIGSPAKIPCIVVFIVVNGFVYWVNQWARIKQLLPLEAQLEALLRSAETGEAVEETHAANLRPIVLSLASADKVKPVEFKIDFWQIALYGEIGIVGFWFFFLMPASQGFNLSGSALVVDYLVRLISWEHLLWLPLFVVGGLIYSWLVQKTTERAVGISALGIHLARGVNLLLWDEIKEVRPLRVLNIRSLWLIRENGEKTILPWTGLERQTELKAAVERFAPAGHPIRNYLSLLRRA